MKASIITVATFTNVEIKGGVIGTHGCLSCKRMSAFLTIHKRFSIYASCRRAAAAAAALHRRCTVLEQLASPLENSDTGYERGSGLKSVGLNDSLFWFYICCLYLFCSGRLINSLLIPENICLADRHQFHDILSTLLYGLQPK